MSDNSYFHDEGALLDRLSKGLKRRSQEVVFLVGAPLCQPGVPGVEGVIDLIRNEFADDDQGVSAFNSRIEQARGNRYQEAFVFLQGRRGPQTANEIIRKAVFAARTTPTTFVDANQSLADDECRRLEHDISNWSLPPGVESLGGLIVGYQDRFGRSILTTNFDPLIEVAIRRAGGNYFRTTLHSDGNFSNTEGNGCHIVHLHGYWYGSDTLHTARQLGQPRPHLRDSLTALLRNKLVVVCGYGGWDDSFTEAMMGVVRDETAFPEILWTFYGREPKLNGRLADRLAPGIDRGRVNLYAGIDCHRVFPQLHEIWLTSEPPTAPLSRAVSNPVHASEDALKRVETLILGVRNSGNVVLEGDDEDRPPVVDICVGREQELEQIKNSQARVVFLTGLGGQGKSTLAARYFADCQTSAPSFEVYVWRDCKEESERFENQLSSVVERLSGGTISGKDLAQQDTQSIVHSFMQFAAQMNILFVFDNVDHYVDLESGLLIGAPDVFVHAIQQTGLKSRVIFTCRPSISYSGPLVLNVHLEGLSLEATHSLFTKRSANANSEELRDAREMTNGHAFWLDLLAIQVAKAGSNARLADLVNELERAAAPQYPRRH
jgi:hypothetical protein